MATSIGLSQLYQQLQTAFTVCNGNLKLQTLKIFTALHKARPPEHLFSFVLQVVVGHFHYAIVLVSQLDI